MNICEQDIQKLDAFIEGAKEIVITAHIHPDGDAAGSTNALLGYLRSRGKDNARIVYPEPLADTISFIAAGTDCRMLLDPLTSPEESMSAIAGADLIFCLDCNSFARTGPLEDAMRSSSARKVLIDHHLAPDTGAFDLVFSTPEVSSACELLYNVLLALPDVGGDVSRLPQPSAEALMAGMTTDTNNFSNSVYPSTFAMASGLLAAGVDRDGILQKLFNEYRENRLRMMGWLLYENMRITDAGVAYMIITTDTAEKFGIREGETEGFVNMPLAIGRVKMSILLKIDGNGYFRVSVRSKKGYSSNLCATRYFHGGGHENASGGRLFFPQDIPSPDEAAGYVERVTGELFKEEGYV
ncbi:MAG: bifunctional oligoribonuclease/PAP phosphatase NrnA [Bacteroidales bacterium]|nr:bifunctional oligoribonuclease/PAP phosphatase NrnA [Bacteroidales bacterium]